MKTPIPRTVHEEIAVLDQLEQALVALTTAHLEEVARSPITTHRKTGVPVPAGSPGESDGSAETALAAAQRGDAAPPSRG